MPKNSSQGKIGQQFALLAENAGIGKKIFKDIMGLMVSKSLMVEKLITASFLDETTKRNYWQSYQGRLKQFLKV